MILSPTIVAIMILNLLFVFFGWVALVLSLRIARYWDSNATTKRQYQLEKQSYLGATVIQFIFIIKLPIFAFFVYTLDGISHLLTGAMCAAGVVDATREGLPLLILKIANIYLFGLWLVLHHRDMSFEHFPFTRLKFGLFIAGFVLLMAEIYLEIAMFSAIDVDKIVSCCGSLYSSSSTSHLANLFTLPSSTVVALFYGSFILLVLLYLLKNRYLFAFSNLIYLFVSIVSLILFFAPYIYELPTHHCPFCILQRDYYYMGYLLYILLFVGTFHGISLLANPQKRGYNVSLIANSLYALMVSGYVLRYYWVNGVWL
ncbi:MAG: hypothetical protein KU28_06180 [Sulfurovum sp. PC08-66]|nr:MAG: hypothetical protein KU28_06180 [Sulfurovum sp. PC08-66]